jgi:hypothetical protein
MRENFELFEKRLEEFKTTYGSFDSLRQRVGNRDFLELVLLGLIREKLHKKHPDTVGKRLTKAYDAIEGVSPDLRSNARDDTYILNVMTQMYEAQLCAVAQGTRRKTDSLSALATKAASGFYQGAELKRAANEIRVAFVKHYEDYSILSEEERKQIEDIDMLQKYGLHLLEEILEKFGVPFNPSE